MLRATTRWLLLFLLGCAGALPASPEPASPTPAAPEPEPELMRISATWGARADGVPEIALEVSVAVGFIEPSPATVTLFFAPIELGDGDSSAVRFLTAEGPVEVDRSAGTLVAPVVDGVARFRYRVALEHPAHAPIRGIDNAPHPSAGGWTVPGVVLFPTFARIDDGRSLDGECALAMRLPAGWSHHHSARSGGDDARRIAHFAEFAQAIHSFGTYELHAIPRGQSVVRVLSSDYDASSLAPLRRLITRTLDLGTELLGELPGGALTIVVDRVGDTFEGGLIGTRGIVISGPDPGSLRAHEMPGLIVVHELMHLWSRADDPWLNEGFTRMLEIAFGVLLEDLDGPAATAELARRLDRYQATAGTSRRVRGDSAGAWPYEGGLATLLCVEADLRQADTSLLEVHRSLRAAHGLPLRVEDFRAALEDAAPGLGARLDTWLDHRGPIDFAPCLAQLGVEAHVEPRRHLTPRALVVDVLGARGIDTDRMVVTAVGPGSPFAPGDRILQVRGQRAGSLDEISWALAETVVGEEFTVEIERAGETRALSLEMAALGDDSFTQVPRVWIAPGAAAGRVFAAP